MIRRYLLLLDELGDVGDPISSTHLPGHVVEPIERELLELGRYVHRTPQGYPADLAERHGYRRLSKSRNGLYHDKPLRVGTMTLHVGERDAAASVESLCMIYMGETTRKRLLENSPVQGVASAEVGMVLLHDNGVISAFHLDGFREPIQAIANSWSPEGKEGYGRWPYPERKEQVYDTLDRIARFAGQAEGRTFAALPDFVMLAKRVHEKARRPSV